MTSQHRENGRQEYVCFLPFRNPFFFSSLLLPHFLPPLTSPSLLLPHFLPPSLLPSLPLSGLVTLVLSLLVLYFDFPLPNELKGVIFFAQVYQVHYVRHKHNKQYQRNRVARIEPRVPGLSCQCNKMDCVNRCSEHADTSTHIPSYLPPPSLPSHPHIHT